MGSRMAERIGLPAVLKTRTLGYDGKGQLVLREKGDIELAWALPGGVPLILEGFVELRREVSILGVRGRSGETAFYPLAESVHRHGILPTSRSRPRSVRTTGAQLRRAPALPYGLCGVVAPELFDIGDTLLANEMAPRVHDSGHRTIEGAETSQFENHLRAILGLPLGGTAPLGHAAMVNFIGAMPEPARALAVPGALRPLSASPSLSNFLAQTGRRLLARYGGRRGTRRPGSARSGSFSAEEALNESP